MKLLFFTSAQEMHANNMVKRPFNAECLLNNADGYHLQKSEGGEFIEISATPEFLYKKFYPGCLKGNEKLIIKRLGGAGDVIWTLAIARELKFRYPLLKISYLLDERHRDLITGNPYVDEFLPNPQPIRKLNEYDYILDYYESIERNRKAEYHGLDSYDHHYEIAFNENPAKEWNVTGNIFLTEKEIEMSKEIFGSGYIVLAMSSSNPKRTWFFMQDLAERILKEYPDKKIILTGQGDFSFFKHDKIINLINRVSLRELLVIIKNAGILFCTDSGNLHFAGQLGVPCLGLFSTVSDTNRVLRYPSVVSMMSGFHCAPCHKLAEPCSHEPECLSILSPEKVFKKFKEVFGKCT